MLNDLVDDLDATNSTYIDIIVAPQQQEECGNDIIDGDDVCDGIDLGGKTCEDFWFAGGH